MSTSKIVLIILGVIAGFFMLAVVGSAMNLVTIPWLKFNKQVQMNRDIVTKTYDASNALYNYHWFQERAAEIKATEQKIAIAEQEHADFEASAGARSTWTFEDKNEDSRQRAVILGLKTYYKDIGAEYNARAAESDRAIFKDELPLFFNLNAY